MPITPIPRSFGSTITVNTTPLPSFASIAVVVARTRDGVVVMHTRDGKVVARGRDGVVRGRAL